MSPFLLLQIFCFFLYTLKEDKVLASKLIHSCIHYVFNRTLLRATRGMGLTLSVEPHPCSAYCLVQREEIKYVRMGVASVAVVRRLTWKGFPLLNSEPI